MNEEVPVDNSTVTKKRNKWDEETIISKGREMFAEKGFDLSMRDIAKALDTQASSLYRHIQGKRELWFAITIKDFEEFAKGMNDIALKHPDSPKELLKEIAFYFLKFARDDFNRFKLMFLYEPPKDNKVGPYEQACKPESLHYLVHYCDLLIKKEGLTGIKPQELAILYYSEILGYAVLKSPINDYLLEQSIFKDFKEKKFDLFIVESIIELVNQFKT